MHTETMSSRSKLRDRHITTSPRVHGARLEVKSDEGSFVGKMVGPCFRPLRLSG